ncbi:tripartite tricarboxylate transporter substrate binding protein [Microbaculum marinum]|uniref:Tripartite tricarboxylate transporter substrate binding protein n=1 Tax=Microbaculum marinum TaxID=1764581 RepID=A0AAW9RRT0_9HYPH
MAINKLIRFATGCVLMAMSTITMTGNEARSDEYPSRPIEVVVPFSPGGTSDLSARYLADKWSEFLGQPVYVVNKPGAGSALGAKLVSEAEPDGYTLMLGSESPLLVVRILQSQVDYELDDFDLLYAYAKGSVYFAVKKDARWASLDEFIEEARQRPGELTYGTHGVGSLSHFIGEILWREAGVEVAHIPFKSSAEENAALIGGHLDLGIPPSLGSLGDSGEIRLLANTGDERAIKAPDVPTLKELGYDASLKYHSILVGPDGLPEDVKTKLIEAHKQAYDKYGDELDESLIQLELTPNYLTGDQAREAIESAEGWMRPLADKLGLTQ